MAMVRIIGTPAGMTGAAAGEVAGGAESVIPEVLGRRLNVQVRKVACPGAKGKDFMQTDQKSPVDRAARLI